MAQRIDDNAGYVMPILAKLMAVLPKVSAAVDIPPEKLEQELEQRTEMYELREIASQLRSDVTDTRRQTSQAARAMLRAVVGHIKEQLGPGRLDRKEQERLRSDAAELLAIWHEAEQQPVAERRKTREASRLHERLLAEEQNELLRTLVDLRNGEPLEQGLWDRAAEIYDSLVGKCATEGRRARQR